MSAPAVKGWCPGALRPMLSGDGYVVRIRPRSGRITASQLAAIATLSRGYGNGLVDVTSRANIQMRGIAEVDHEPLIAALRTQDLIDETVSQETARNILVTPFWREGDGTRELADELADLLADGMDLPAKFGFAVDTGSAPVLASASADIRLERTGDGQLILRAHGMAFGCAVDNAEAAAKAVALARWFLASGGAPAGRGRMARHLAQGARLPDAFAPALRPAAGSGAVSPGRCDTGFLAGIEFGQATADLLDALATLAPAFRLTPWHMLLLEGIEDAPSVNGVITGRDVPLLHVSACTGAPGCPQALAATRDLARRLAPHIPASAHLHVSGCAKGCARSVASDFVLTATAKGFDLARNAKAGDAPVMADLCPAAMAADPTLVFGTA